MSKGKIATIFPKQQTFPHAPARIYYYLLDFNEANEWVLLHAHYGVMRLSDLTKTQFWEYFTMVSQLDIHDNTTTG